jgi:hypothetical protein
MAVTHYERHLFWQGVQEDFARLQANPAAWDAYLSETREWDSLTTDGLESALDESSGAN